MSKEAEYRTQAVVCLELAKHAANATDRLRILGIAAAWLDLADRVNRPVKRAAELPEAPEVRAALGD